MDCTLHQYGCCGRHRRRVATCYEITVTTGISLQSNVQHIERARGLARASSSLQSHRCSKARASVSCTDRQHAQYVSKNVCKYR